MSDDGRRLVVALDARLRAGEWGGVQQVVQGLAGGLARLDGPDEFLFVAYEDAADWLDPHLGGRARRIVVPRSSGQTVLRRAYDTVTRLSPGVGRHLESAWSRIGRGSVPIPESDGTIEKLGVDLVHFLLPQAYVTSVPSVYQVHDLLHIHHPEMFSAVHRRYREQTYRTFARRARMVTTMTEWGRQQIVELLGMPASSVAVVPWAPVISTPSLSDSQLPGGLPESFVLYPAQTWRHKNHVSLVEAVALLKNRDLRVEVICVGRLTAEFATIERRVHDLGLDGQVRFRGLVPATELARLYQSATALIFPSRYEGFGLPIVEAFASSLPVAASNAAAVPEVAGGAALLFDPDHPSTIANAIERIVTEDRLRAELRIKGEARSKAFSWTDSAKRFRALYRSIAGRKLEDEDVELLGAPVTVE